LRGRSRHDLFLFAREIHIKHFSERIHGAQIM
jgi:hypothetical protein